MIFKQLIELYDLLDSPAASGAGVVEYLRGIDPACDCRNVRAGGAEGLHRYGARAHPRVRAGAPPAARRPPSACWDAWAALGRATRAHRLRVGRRRRT